MIDGESRDEEVQGGGGGDLPPPKWRRWLAGTAGAAASLAALTVKFGVVPPPGLGRMGGLAMIFVAAPMATRAYVHVRIGYLLRLDRGEAPVERRKGRRLSALVCFDFSLAAGLAAAGSWYLAHPDNWQELGAAVTALVAIALSSDATLRLIHHFDLPRGSDVIQSCVFVIWLRELAEHLRDVPGVSKLDSLWDKQTMKHRVSWLIVVLLSLLAATVLLQIVAVTPDIESYLIS